MRKSRYARIANWRRIPRIHFAAPPRFAAEVAVIEGSTSGMRNAS